jgi:hypothetical protein
VLSVEVVQLRALDAEEEAPVAELLDPIGAAFLCLGHQGTDALVFGPVGDAVEAAAPGVVDEAPEGVEGDPGVEVLGDERGEGPGLGPGERCLGGGIVVRQEVAPERGGLAVDLPVSVQVDVVGVAATVGEAVAGAEVAV